MTRPAIDVTLQTSNPYSIPDYLSPGLLMLLDLEHRGVLDEAGQRLRIRREGGYCGLDVFVTLVLYYLCSGNEGLKRFIERAHPFSAKLAGIAGRVSLPTQASMSRALRSVELELLRPAASWLLLDAPDVLDVLQHPATHTFDANGEAWFIVEHDAKVKAFRRRGLPHGEDLPEPHLRTEDLAAAGYPGRKRGEVQVRASKLQHAGSGVCLAVRSGPGNGDRREEEKWSLATLVNTANRLGYPLERSLLVADGEHGGVPSLTAFRAHGVPFITRLTRPQLFETAEVRQRLAQAHWVEVPDSGSGPRRSAADLGICLVFPGESTRTDAGEAYEPVEVRVVVSRFERDKPAQRGVVVDGWQYELFSADVPSDAWPASDVVATYFRRARQENQFAQENRVLNLDRALSYDPAGYEFSMLVGHMVSNYAIMRGFELAKPPAIVDELEPRNDQPDPRPVPTSEPIEKEYPVETVDTAEQLATVEQQIRDRLSTVEWNLPRLEMQGFNWLFDERTLLCPLELPMVLSMCRTISDSRSLLVFRSTPFACEKCSVRTTCNTSARPRKAKERSIAVASEGLEELPELLTQASLLRRRMRSEASLRRRYRVQTKRSAETLTRLIHDASTETKPGPWALRRPTFLPAVAHRSYISTLEGFRTYVAVDALPKSPPTSNVIAFRQREIGHGRMTWQEHFDRYALLKAIKVHVQIEPLTGPVMTTSAHALLEKLVA